MAASDSRFKPFKFNSHSKPPPLPPKDSVYLAPNNPSISSIDIPPNSPRSPPATRKDKALAFLKFPKRSPRSPNARGSGEGSFIIVDELENPPPPEPDSQISSPWNFQHNIHVDEGYIGLPPSWSTSLATAGFTPEEIADIQTRRAAGALAPPDLRYLYTERPTSPRAPCFQSTIVPIISSPASRMASLPLTELERPPFPKPVTSSPPKRKPTEERSQNGHKPNQNSSSTTYHSSDSHQSNPTASSSYNPQSAAQYRYVNPSISTSNLSSHSGHSTTDEDGQTPLARVPHRLNSNDPLSRSASASQTDSGPSTRFFKTVASEFGVARKLDESESKDSRPRAADRTIIPKPIWGTKRTITENLSNPSLSSLASLAKSPSYSPQSIPTSSPFVAAASSSLSTLKVAAASTSLSIAAAVRNTKGVIRRGLGTSRENGNTESVDPEDEEFISDVLEIDATSGDDLSVAGPGGRKAVWQLYTQPKTSTDTSSSKPLEANQQQRTDTTVWNGRSYQSPLPFSRSQGSLRSLARQRSVIKKTSSQDSLNTQESVSQDSLNPVPAAAPASGSGLGTGDVKSIMKHKNSGSITSLESIPEAEGSPSELHAMASNAASSSSPSKKPLVTPAVLPTTRPPYLTLPHQAKASLDLSLWSETLLSGISKSGELDLAFTFGEGGKEMAEGKRRKEKEKDRDRWDGEGIVKNEMSVEVKEKEKDEKEPGSSLATARPSEYPARITNKNPNVSATAAMSHRQQPIPTKPRYPAPARPIPPININNNASTSTSIPLVEKQPPHKSHSKPGSPTAPRPAILPPFSPPPNGIVAHSHHHPAYGQSPMPPPVVPLPPPPTVSNVLSGATTLRSILSSPPTSATLPTPMAAGMLSPPPSTAYPQSLKSPTSVTSSTGPDSAQLWNEIEAMMDPGLVQRMGVGGVDSGKLLGLPSASVKGSVKTAEGGPVPGQAQALRVTAASPELDESTCRPGVITATVGDLVGSSPDPSAAAALTEGFSPVLPFSPEEDRVATTRVLRAGEGVLGTKTRSQGAERKNVEEGEGYVGDSEYADLMDLEEEGSDGINYSDLEEPVVYISKAPVATDKPSMIPGNHVEQHSREALPTRDQANRYSSRSSSSTLTAEAVAAAAATTIVRKVSIARRTGAVVLKRADVNSALLAPAPSHNSGRNSPSSPITIHTESKHPPSPLSSNFGNSSEESAGSLSHSLSPSSASPDNYPTPATDSASLASPLTYYLDGTQTPSPLPVKMAFGPLPPLPPAAAATPQPSKMKAQNKDGVNINNYDYDYSPSDDDEEDGAPFAYPDEAMVEAVHASMAAAAAVTSAPRPTIIISDEPVSAAVPTAATTSVGTAPLSPFQQYRGWLSAIVAPLEEFIDGSVDPRDHYLDLKEIAEGESGSVFSARLNPLTASKLRLPPLIKAKDAEEMSQGPEGKLVAIKSVAIVPSGSPKLVDLQRELMLMKGLAGHENVLGMDGVYVDLVEDSLWVRMELMERSLADMVELVGHGLMLQDRMLARFASDVLSALDYLQKHFIAHRDVRSDNLLLNKHGFLKLADFSNAVQVTKDSPMRTDPAGVIYWQAPEVPKPPYNLSKTPYNALKVDVWSLGATVWEMAQTEPPFSDTQQFGDRWPPLRRPELYSPAFHDFLRKCSEPASSRPNPSDLLRHNFVHNACGRPVIIHLLSQCVSIERSLQEIDASP